LLLNLPTFSGKILSIDNGFLLWKRIQPFNIFEWIFNLLCDD